MAIVQQIALNMIKNKDMSEGRIRTARFKARLDIKCLEKLLDQV